MLRRRSAERKGPVISEEDLKKYGEPIKVETVKETGEVFVIWRKRRVGPQEEERDRKYYITKWDPLRRVHKEAGHLNVWYQPSAEGEVRMAHVEVKRGFRRRGLATKLHQAMQEDHKGKGLWLEAIPSTVPVHERAGYIPRGKSGYEGMMFMYRPKDKPPVQARIKPKPSFMDVLKRLFKRRRRK